MLMWGPLRRICMVLLTFWELLLFPTINLVKWSRKWQNGVCLGSMGAVSLKFSITSLCLDCTEKKKRFLPGGHNLRWHKFDLCRAAAFQTGCLICVNKPLNKRSLSREHSGNKHLKTGNPTFLELSLITFDFKMLQLYGRLCVLWSLFKHFVL